jgi:hypothetical protein
VLCSFCGAASGNAGFCTSCGRALAIPSASAKRPEPSAAPPETKTVATATAAGTLGAPARSPRETASVRQNSRDPRRRRTLASILAVSLTGVLFAGGAFAALWWLFSGASDDRAVAPNAEVAPGEYGSDPELDILWDACAQGSFESCDDLYLSSEQGSEYERFGATCGDRAEASGSCAVIGGTTQPGQEGTFGSDTALDFLWTECEDGNMSACDDLYLESPVGSDYEQFGATCGGRGDSAGACASQFP